MHYHLAQITGIAQPATYFSAYSDLPATLAGRFAVFAIAAAGLYFFLRIILSGFAFLTSNGDPGKIQDSYHQILNASYGLIIVIAAFLILQAMQTILGINII